MMSSHAADNGRQEVTSKPVRRPAEGERSRPDASFKIKDSFRQISQTQPVVKIQHTEVLRPEVKEREPIDEQKVSAALEAYIREYRPEPTVAIALKTHHPEIQGENILIAVDNQLQLDKLEALKIHLQNALVKSLNNGFISLVFQLFDNRNSKEERKFYTAGEKFQHFVELNPVVADLKSVFGLEIE